jgi:hypothetical protein
MKLNDTKPSVKNRARDFNTAEDYRTCRGEPILSYPSILCPYQILVIWFWSPASNQNLFSPQWREVLLRIWIIRILERLSKLSHGCVHASRAASTNRTGDFAGMEDQHADARQIAPY